MASAVASSHFNRILRGNSMKTKNKDKASKGSRE